MQKYFQEDFPSKKCHRNDGQLPKYYVEADHDAIVAPELFDYAQSLHEERSEEEKSRYSGVDYLSSKIICGKCGRPFGPRPWHSTTYNNVVWQCRTAGGHKHYGGNCGNHHVYDEILKMLLHDMARELMKERGVLDVVAGLERENLSERKAVEVGSYLDRFICGDIWETAEDLDDLAYILKKATVTEDGRLVAEFLDGTTAERILPEYSPLKPKKADEQAKAKAKATAVEPEKAEGNALPPGTTVKKCRNCGGESIQMPKVRSKLFCCKECRMDWWKAHPETLDRKANYEYICEHCDKRFISYGNDHRKYLSLIHISEPTRP